MSKSTLQPLTCKSPSAVFLLCLAIIIQIVFVNYKQDYSNNGHGQDYIGSDAKSAIRRAKSDKCKKEFKQFISGHPENAFESLPIERNCPLDIQSIVRILTLGCTTTNSTSLYLTIDEPVNSLVYCQEFCFSCGHAVASHDLISKKCHCADNEFITSTTFKPCDRYIGSKQSNSSLLKWFKVNNGIYYPSRGGVVELVESNQTMRIAFLLTLNGRSTQQITKLFKRIYSKRHVYYLHIDARQQYLPNALKSLIDEHNNIIISSKRFETIWGGTALLSMMMSSMKDLATIRYWDYLINLSESDFPLKSLGELESYLASQNSNSIYLKLHNIKGYKFFKKQGLDHNFYQCEGRVWRLGKRKLPRNIVYTGGSDWFGLPRNFCNYIIENVNTPSSLVNTLVKFYNFTLLPAESFFHTLALNSEFCDKFVDNNLRITNWQRKHDCKCQHKDVVDWCGCSPLVYRWSDWDRLERTKYNPSLFFSRKFDATLSSSIISAVESHLLDRNAETTQLDTRYWLNIYESSEEQIHLQAYKEFGKFALRQADDLEIDDLQLKSINLHFNRDQFIGMIYEYCKSSGLCKQMLISQIKVALVKLYNETCYAHENNRKLEKLQVNHGFDSNEKIFRNFMPLHSLSDVAVQHEWLVGRNQNATQSVKEERFGEVIFKWINPKGEIESIQRATLKMTSKLHRYSLVHRLLKNGPLRSGLWKLIVSYDRNDCLTYQFLVFDEKSFIEQTINQSLFKEYYHVTNVCINSLERPPEHFPKIYCNRTDWSIVSKDLKQANYSL